MRPMSFACGRMADKSLRALKEGSLCVLQMFPEMRCG